VYVYGFYSYLSTSKVPTLKPDVPTNGPYFTRVT